MDPALMNSAQYSSRPILQSGSRPSSTRRRHSGRRSASRFAMPETTGRAYDGSCLEDWGEAQLTPFCLIDEGDEWWSSSD